MIKIYISSDKLDVSHPRVSAQTCANPSQKADALYQSMVKNKSFTPDPALWLSYATFLMTTLRPASPDRARLLLPRATQSVPSSQHRYLTQKFASLEFKLENGDPERGRTIFEKLVSTWPKKWDVWDVYLSLEVSHGGTENVRGLFERMTKAGMKKRRADAVFRRWKGWEATSGSADGVKKAIKAEAEWNEQKAAKGGEE
jgi:rRNA biogenesis protein RRP5